MIEADQEADNMSNLLKAGDSEPEQPLREGWLVKQSGGSAGIGRRRSVGELMKKWDERYFVLTIARLYYFKTMDDFKRGNASAPSGIILIKDHVIEPTPSNCEFILRGFELLTARTVSKLTTKDWRSGGSRHFGPSKSARWLSGRHVS